ncbi:tetratricopeptide repeat protein [Streptomyces sp. NPDC058735]|uniref:tetratricopeptide repeat protein n=1 Tax=unclassified Streptomyces TaxID=2593676 RepID=UPI00368EC8DD
MARLSREKKREQKQAAHTAAPAAPIDVHVPGAGTETGAAAAQGVHDGATVGGVPVFAAPGEEIQRAVLERLHHIALATGRPVLATVHDERIGYVVPLRVDPDGSSHFTSEPVRTAPAEPERPQGDKATHVLRPVPEPARETAPTFPLSAVPGPQPADEPAPTFELRAVQDPAPPEATAPPGTAPQPEATAPSSPSGTAAPSSSPGSAAPAEAAMPSGPVAPPGSAAPAEAATPSGPVASPGTVAPPAGEFGPPPPMDVRQFPGPQAASGRVPGAGGPGPQAPAGDGPHAQDRAGADSGASAGADSGGDPYAPTDARPNPYARTDPPPNPYARTDAGPAAHARTDAGPDSQAGTDPPPNPYARTDAGPAAHARTDAGPGPHARTDAGPSPHARTDNGPSPHARTDPGPAAHVSADVRPRPLPDGTRRPERQREAGPGRGPGPGPGLGPRSGRTRRAVPDAEAALLAADPDPRPTPARGFDAVAEAVLGDEPLGAPGDPAPPAFLVEPVTRINEAVKEGRIEAAAALADRTVTQASGTLGPEHPEVLRLRELTAYISYLAGEPLRAFQMSLDLAGARRRAGDAEGAYGSVRSAATAWRAVRDPALGLELGRDLVGLWTELAAEDGPAAGEIEELESARARMGRLTERARNR